MSEKTPKFKRRAEARPDEVLDAALALFVEKGFAATTMAEVAARAGLSKGAVYLYFPSKDALLEAIVHRAIAPIAAMTFAQLTNFEGDPRLVLKEVLTGLIRTMSDPKRIAIPKLVMREALQAPHIAEMYKREVLSKAIPTLAGLLQRGMEQGYLRPLDAELTVRSIVGPIVLHLLLAEVFAITPKDGLALERLVENHMAILFDGLSARPETKQ